MKRLCALMLVVLALAATPKPKPSPREIQVHLPNIPLHAEYTVEVNSRGQIVRVTGGKGDNKYPFWNAQTYGNVLQMWIRHPDGTATVGRYRVSFDYDPHSKLVHRGIKLLAMGGNWANETGAADAMVQEAKDEAQAAQKAQERQQQQEQQDAKNLPALQNIVGPTPTPQPT